jgi:hypothetical protein
VLQSILRHVSVRAHRCAASNTPLAHRGHPGLVTTAAATPPHALQILDEAVKIRDFSGSTATILLVVDPAALSTGDSPLISYRAEGGESGAEVRKENNLERRGERRSF